MIARAWKKKRRCLGAVASLVTARMARELVDAMPVGVDVMPVGVVQAVLMNAVVGQTEPERAPLGDRFEAPRLGDAAFRAQRDALEQAQFALRKLSAQAHGEALTQLLQAWEQRDVAQLPSVQDLGNRVTPAVRSAWVKVLGQAPCGSAGTALLRLEMASELPTPADYLSDRRLLQLQLLTRRNDPATDLQTWGQDTAAVLASAFDAGPGTSSAKCPEGVVKTLTDAIRVSEPSQCSGAVPAARWLGTGIPVAQYQPLQW